MFRKLAIPVVFVLTIAAPAAHAVCPAGQFFLDLKNCTTAAMAGVTFQPGGACAPAPVVAGCPAAAGWKQAALRIAIPAGCTQANVVVEYEGLPAGWTVNLGDSPTDNGFAGDSGTTEHDAELWVLNEILAVADGGAAPDNPLVRADLALTDGALKLVVKDQFVSWGNPYGYVQMPATKNLFAIPDTSVPAADQRAVYLGLNRVIFGPADRTGCGARRALVTFK
jgi:hypothetical protein